MTLDIEDAQVGPVAVKWSSFDCMLYALAVGSGDLPADLRYITENSMQVTQRVLPTFPLSLQVGQCLFEKLNLPGAGQALHAGQLIRVHRPLPPDGEARCVRWVSDVIDKGHANLIVTRTEAREPITDDLLWDTESIAYLRRPGGKKRDRRTERPDAGRRRAADLVLHAPTRADQALVYRLTGDRNPLHSDPTAALRAGFDRPILHGLCTFGLAGRMLLEEMCASDERRFVSMSARFSKPVYPGQDIEVAVWRTGATSVVFEAATDDGRTLESGEFTFKEVEKH